jgi:type I restriction enzyme S subunit
MKKSESWGDYLMALSKLNSPSSSTVSLSKLIRGAQSGFASGERATDGVIQIRMNNVTTDGSLDWTNFIRVPASQKQIEKYRLRPGDVLFNSTNSPELVGKTTTFQGHKEPVVFSNHFIRLRVDESKLDAEYLARWLIKQWQLRTFERFCTRWVNQATVRKEDLLALEIPLPSLDEQKHIAAILNKANRLRRLRRYARELSDGYLGSVFLEMFGDPVSNPMGWERAKVSDLGKVQTGNTPSRSNPENYGDFIEWIKSDNITNDEMFVSRSREMLSKAGLKNGRFVNPGSILVVCIAGSPTSIGNIALTDRRVAFNQQINAVTPYKGVDPIFLYGLFRVAKPQVQRSTTLGMKRIITKSKFEKLVLIKPSFPLQQEFAEIVQKYERLRAQQREAERQAEHLFQSLLHRAFRGEL